MASSTIQLLKSTLGMGARTNKYRVILNAKGNGPDNVKVDTLVKSATIPGRSFADVVVTVQGRAITVAGDAQYDGNWSLTFLDTEDHSLRGSFLDWMDFIDDVQSHSRGATSHADYMTDATIQQLSTIDNSVQATYILHNLYPKSISEIAYADDNSSMVEFTVEFNYSHWTRG